jgi:acyl-coenzyme A thioesterase PaaI-like protein
MATLRDTFKGAPIGAEGTWSFELETPFNGAFGGTNGGVLSALSVFVARSMTGRRPSSIDSRYLRGFRPGTARVVPRLLNSGRTLSVVSIDIFDADDKLCTHSAVTLAERSALAETLHHPAGATLPENLKPTGEGKVWRSPAGQPIPLIDTFQPTAVGGAGDETLTATKVVWREPGTAAEAACIAADISVGPPVARAVRGAASTPNPDLSLRFCAEPEVGDHLVASCRLEGIDAGLASTRINVWSGATLLAIGVSTTTCIPL